MTPSLEVALGYIERGWAPVPTQWLLASGSCACPAHRDCANPGKHPRVRWRDIEVVNDAQARAWWARWPRAGVAILTGPSRLVVVDVDPRHGGDASLAALMAAHSALPGTLSCRTGGGGEHRYFAAVADVEIRNDQDGRLGAGVDVRAAGGLVVAPPSMHHSGRRYEWADPVADVAPAPAWLVDLLRPTAPPPQAPRGELRRVSTGYAGAALTGECRAVAASASGGRNQQLNRSAFALGQLVGAGALDEAEVTDHLLHAALTVGLGEFEARTTIRSGLEAGRRTPRHIAS